jgi:hypothetical protein
MKFMIRDLLWLTVVALGVGWWLRERHLHEQAAQAKDWRTRAGALELGLGTLGWKVTRHGPHDPQFPNSVMLDRKKTTPGKNTVIHVISTTKYEPSADLP